MQITEIILFYGDDPEFIFMFKTKFGEKDKWWILQKIQVVTTHKTVIVMHVNTIYDHVNALVCINNNQFT